MTGLTDPVLNPEDDAFIRDALADLDHPTMPAHVADRITTTLRAESLSRAADDSDIGGRRRSGRERWFIAGSGIAAACAIGFVVLSTLGSHSAPPGPAFDTAAIVPMSASGTHYSHDNLASQVKRQLHVWQAEASHASARSAMSQPTASDSITTTNSAAPSPEPTASVTPVAGTTPSPMQSTVERALNECLRTVVNRPPMYVDLALFDGPTNTNDEVAVVAVPDTDQQVDVYVVGIQCTSNDNQVRAHVRIPED